MKHAGSAALDTVEPLLGEIRSVPSLTERKRGVFYRKSTAFLHFHEDPAGIFADVRDASGWQRLPVNSDAERGELLRRIRQLAASQLTAS
jgi:hypothetical protein